LEKRRRDRRFGLAARASQVSITVARNAAMHSAG